MTRKMKFPDRTLLQHDELDAVTGDRMAVLRIVGALRRYRAEFATLLKARLSDGSADGTTINSLMIRVEEIETQ